MKRTDLASRIGRLYHDVMRLERGQKPDPATILQICDVCGVTERWLLRGPVYSEAFKSWLANEAPADLHDVEREVLGSVVFPEQHHPGAQWYSVALGAWRMGTSASLTAGTHVRRAAPRLVPSSSRPPPAPTPRVR